MESQLFSSCLWHGYTDDYLRTFFIAYNVRYLPVLTGVVEQFHLFEKSAKPCHLEFEQNDKFVSEFKSYHRRGRI